MSLLIVGLGQHLPTVLADFADSALLAAASVSRVCQQYSAGTGGVGYCWANVLLIPGPRGV